ncbi:sigma factor-like helix-turn-helix DNA-binding protein [Propioniciclava sp. MC1595]|uniref:sigma factor-like helix-turn-helix DNA-binding protein n=1 Tax=Propioniciclava sp. MC1595 TaxID=2760308 RepID=UPI0035CD03F6
MDQPAARPARTAPQPAGRHVLHYLADLPVARVAEELDAQPGTVRVWLSRGRDRLGVLLDEDKEPRHA